jgi:hypothetical protein
LSVCVVSVSESERAVEGHMTVDGRADHMYSFETAAPISGCVCSCRGPWALIYAALFASSILCPVPTHSGATGGNWPLTRCTPAPDCATHVTPLVPPLAALVQSDGVAGRLGPLRAGSPQL